MVKFFVVVVTVQTGDAVANAYQSVKDTVTPKQ